MKVHNVLVPVLLVAAGAVALTISFGVRAYGLRHSVAADEAPHAQVAIVLGAGVDENGVLSAMLADRVATAVALYRAGKVSKLLMSGDHGSRDYDEVNNMRRYAEKHGVPTQDIFMDHAGFNTYDTMVRARKVFQVESALVVTQAFHLPRAVYLARSQGIDATGVSADRRPYLDPLYFEVRDAAARLKDFFLVNVIHPEPRFLGPALPITGDGRTSQG